MDDGIRRFQEPRADVGTESVDTGGVEVTDLVKRLRE